MAEDMGPAVARFLREDKDRIITCFRLRYTERYPWSKVVSSPAYDQLRNSSIAGAVDELICALEGGPIDPRRWVHYGADNVINASRDFHSIACYIETRYFCGEVLSSLIEEKFLGCAEDANAALDALESVLIKMIQMNFASFEAEKLAPGDMVATWDLELPEMSTEPAIKPAMFEHINGSAENVLTSRESDLARLVVRGMTNREIATELGISLNTVKNTLGRIFDKLGVNNRAELVAKLLAAG